MQKATAKGKGRFDTRREIFPSNWQSSQPRKNLPKVSRVSRDFFFSGDKGVIHFKMFESLNADANAQSIEVLKDVGRTSMF
jgi:hypothetical protein